MNPIRRYILEQALILEMSYEDALHLLLKYDRNFPKSEITDRIIKTYRRKFAKRYHPDTGYRGDDLKILNTALDVIRDEGTGYDSSQFSRQTRQTTRRPGGTPMDQYPNVPIWAWAGYSGGSPPFGDIHRQNYRDINYIKKKAWEMAGKPKRPTKSDEFTFWNFDGRYGRGVFSVFAKDKSNILTEIAKAMIAWDSFFKSKAVLIRKPNGVTEVAPVKNGKIVQSGPWFMSPSSSSFNLNPFNDSSFADKLNAMLDEV
jgi:curved DNA-binding protein CbpA